jgi:hypothetical protein
MKRSVEAISILTRDRRHPYRGPARFGEPAGPADVRRFGFPDASCLMDDSRKAHLGSKDFAS